MKKIVGFVPCKGHSERVQSKNLHKINGLPLFIWAANNLSKVISKNDIFIDTDSDEIIKIAKENGYNAIKRPDYLSTNLTCGNQLMSYESECIDAEIYVQHLPPMLFLSKKTLQKCIDSVLKFGYDSSFTITEESFYLWDKGKPLYDLTNLPNSKDLPKKIIENMGLYVTSKEVIKNSKLRIGKNPKMINITKIESLDIDYEEDLEFAKLIASSPILPEEYRPKINTPPHEIKLIIIDVDGVMTDGGLYYDSKNNYIKKFNAKDGIAIKAAINSGKEIRFLSSGIFNNIISSRAETLGVKTYKCTSKSKKEILDDWLLELKLSYENVACIGDDINDKESMNNSILSACPSDAHKEIKEISKIVLKAKGGEGCVREFFDKYINI